MLLLFLIRKYMTMKEVNNMSAEDKFFDQGVTMTSKFRVYLDDDDCLLLENLRTGEKQALNPDDCYLEFESNCRIGAQTRWWDRSNMREVWN